MMEEFLWKHDIGVTLLQEVTNIRIDTIRRYTKFINIGAKQRGTAIMVKDGLTLTHIRSLPSGRGIAGMFNGTWFVNIYAPSGAEMKYDRETFYNTDLPYVLPTTWTDLVTAGDFNCVLSQSDITEQKNYSRALDNIIQGYKLTDVWDTRKARIVCTHYKPKVASRIDRIYVSRNLAQRKQGVETVAAAFTDHFAIWLRLSLDAPIWTHGRGSWRMNTSLLRDLAFQ
jgi:exonuclease III